MRSESWGYLSKRGGWLSCHARSLTPFFGHAESSRGLGKREDRSSCRGRTISEEFRRQAVDLYESTPGATVRGIAADLGVVRGTLRQWLEAYGTGSWFGYLYLDATYLDIHRHGRPSPRPPSSRSVSPSSDSARSSACPSGTASRPTSGPSSSEACANAVSTPPELPGTSSSMSSGVGEGIPTR